MPWWQMSASDSSSAARPEEAGQLERELALLTGSRQQARWILEDARHAPDPPAAARRLAARRAAGEPLQHLLSRWGFRSLLLRADGRALVPRPETELVVEVALSQLPPAGPLLLADLGTGSGAIALSLAVEVGPRARLFATDVSAPALSLARENAALLAPSHRGLEEQVCFRQGSWFEALPAQVRGQLDLVISNPPYLAAGEWPDLEPVVRDYDPYEALVAGPAGTEAIEVLVSEAPAWLGVGGVVVLEIAPHQAEAALELARKSGFGRSLVRADLAGRPRALVARR